MAIDCMVIICAMIDTIPPIDSDGSQSKHLRSRNGLTLGGKPVVSSRDSHIFTANSRET